MCAAIGRATNTDPVLWRVLLAVLGFFGGIGIVVYVAAWLIIPAEGDTASPVESMLGRGRSSMSPILVIILGILVAVLFGYIVTDAFRAVLLGAAILIGGALLLNRDATGATRRAAPAPPAGSGDAAPPGGGPPAYPGMTDSTVAAGTGTAAASPVAGFPVPSGPVPPTAPPYPAPSYPSWYRPATAPEGTPAGAGEHSGTGPYPAGAWYPTSGATPVDRPAQSGPPQTGEAPSGPQPPNPPAPPSAWPAPPVVGGAQPPSSAAGYRPAFAPHGPYAPAGPLPPAPMPPGRTPKRPKPPKPPRERSPLGAATFSMIFVAIGVVAILDLVDTVAVRPSTYFAAVLITIALGLLIGTWFGRARWLIVLGLVAAAALGISTLAESYDAERADSPVVWRPTDRDALAVRYQARFGNATLDLRQVDFTGQDTPIEVRVDFGTLRVIVPPDVDTTVLAEVNAGDARVFGTRWGGVTDQPREVVDLGSDGAGGGTLRLLLHVKAGDAEVTR